MLGWLIYKILETRNLLGVSAKGEYGANENNRRTELQFIRRNS